MSDARVTISLYEGVYNVWAVTDGETREDAEKMASDVLRFLAGPRLAFIRCEPGANSHKDFATEITTHRGYVRFAFKDEPGEWHRPSNDESVMFTPVKRAVPRE